MRSARFALLVLGLGLACESSSGPPPVTQIKVTPADTAIAAGASVQLRATLVFSDGLPGVSLLRRSNVEWQSLDPTVATVSSNGLVHAEGPSGVAWIRATHDTLSVTVPITVLDSLMIARAKVPSGAYAAAISSANVAYVGQTWQERVLRANLPSRGFTQGITVGNTPTEIAFNSTGARAYVTNQYSSTVSVIDVMTNRQVDTIPVGSRPFEVIVAPGDSILWVGKVDSVYAIRLGTKQIIARFQFGGVANGVVIARDTLLYVSTHGVGTVVEINLRTRTLARTFAVGGVPQKLAVSPDGSELYIANESGYVQFWDLSTGMQIGTNLQLPSAGYGMARRPSNGLLYVTGAYFGGGYLYVVDPVARTLVRSAIVGGSTRHVVFNADGSIGIVPNEGGWVDFIK